MIVSDKFMRRSGKNHDGYHGETINIAEVLCEIEAVARTNRWRSETILEIHGAKILALRRHHPCLTSRSPRYYISTGIHGDEPAGPLAALRLLKDDQWPVDAEVVLLPCLNPVGFMANKRENGQGIDLNRDYQNTKSQEVFAHVTWLEKQGAFDLCFCLHEDWESQGFYLYELNPESKPSLAESMVATVAKACPIDLSGVIEGREAIGGIIRPSLDPNTRPLWPESFWLLQNKTRLSYTLESPSDFAMDVRVGALVAAVQTALKV